MSTHTDTHDGAAALLQAEAEGYGVDVRRPGRGAAAALLRGAQELWDGIARRGYYGAVEIKMSKTLRLNTRVSVVGIERVGSEQLEEEDTCVCMRRRIHVLTIERVGSEQLDPGGRE